MHQLRDYQNEALEAIWSDLHQSNSALCVLPTGCGKTEIFIELLKRSIKLSPNLKAVVLVNKINLLEQTYNRLAKSLDPNLLGIYCGSSGKYESSKSITIASIQSIRKFNFDKLNLIILDEVHNVDQESGMYFDFIQKNNQLNVNLKIVAFTATPYRHSGFIYGDTKIFKRISYKKKMKEMISKGYLVQPRIKKTDHQFDVSKLRVKMGEFSSIDVEKLVKDNDKVQSQIKDALSKMQDIQCAVWACATIDHCERVARVLEEMGEKSVALHSELRDENRKSARHSFESGSVRHLVFVSIVSEGYDFPKIDCIVLMRPIRSPVLYVQVVGRGLRPYKDKKSLLVLDYGRVVETLGPVDDPLVHKSGKGVVNVPRPMKFCPECLDYIVSTATECSTCGHVFKQERDPTKNLTNKAYVGDILSQKNKIHSSKINNVYLKKHISKVGNICLVVVYECDDLLNSEINEYFVTQFENVYKNMQRRLMQLGVMLHANIDDQVKEDVRYIPKTVDYVLEKDKFGKTQSKVKRIHFT